MIVLNYMISKSVIMRLMDVVVTNKIDYKFFYIRVRNWYHKSLVSFFIQPPLHHSHCFYSIPILFIRFVDLFLILLFTFTITTPSKG
jgi:hypothetical protein